LHKEIADLGMSSVLAVLCSPISIEKIKKRVESDFLKASRRIAGLMILSKVICLDVPDASKTDLSNWFTSALRDRTNKITHY
jgi:hypothetical protein